MEKSNVFPLRKNAKQWKTNTVEQPKPVVNLVSVDIATLLYNVVQSQRQMLEKIEELSDMVEHMEYQIDKLRAATPSQPRTDSQDS